MTSRQSVRSGPVSGTVSRAMLDRFLNAYDAYLLDVDGVLVRDSDPISGAAAALASLNEAGRVLLLTNNSTRSRGQHAERLVRLGFDVRADQVLSSSYLAAEYLCDAHGLASVWVIGEDGLRDELLAAGHRLADRPEAADAVVVGMDRGIDYRILADGLRALRSGAQFIATNEDATFPTPDGVQPGAGAMIGALRGMGFTPDVVIGKPSPIAFRMALDAFDLSPKRVVMIGDRLETDILGARTAGLDTALVLSGISSCGDIDGFGIHPTWIADDLAALVRGDVIGPGPASREGTPTDGLDSSA
jgi:phosphoglycolate/pyridoxal phosphate phosphatase family enzyme